MKKFYLITIIFNLLLFSAQAYYSKGIPAIDGNFLLDTSRNFKSKPSTKITDTRADKPAYLKSTVNLNIVPFKPVSASKPSATSANGQKPAVSDVKVVSNVKVYPNPVADQLNLSYNVNKDSNVTIKIMDILGNEIATLLSQKMPAGEQTNSFAIASKLNSGYYFIRLVVGNETIVKRISIL